MHKQTAASISTSPWSTGQHSFTAGSPSPMCTNPPNRSTQAPSFSVSMGHVSVIGGDGQGFPEGGFPVTGGSVTGGFPITGGSVTGGTVTGGFPIIGGSVTGGFTMGGRVIGGVMTGGRVMGPLGGFTLGVLGL